MRKYYALLFFAVVLCIFQTESGLNASGLLGGYKVPKKAIKIDQRRVVGSGSRSQCSISKTKSVELVVPEAKVVHRTLEDRPPLYVYSDFDGPTSAELTLVNVNNSDTLVRSQISLVRGVSRIDLPTSVSLKKGNIYTWNITLTCNNPAREQIVLTAAIEKVDLPKVRVIGTKSSMDLFRVYRENSIWYESVELALEMATAQHRGSSLEDNIIAEDIEIEQRFWQDFLN